MLHPCLLGAGLPEGVRNMCRMRKVALVATESGEGGGSLYISEGRGFASGEENIRKHSQTLEKEGSKVLQRLGETVGRGKMGNLEGNDKNSSGHGNKNMPR